MMMPSDDAMTEVYPVRRMEVFTGAGRRRTRDIPEPSKSGFYAGEDS